MDRLEACIEDAGEPLENLLSAMPCVLDDRVFIWFKSVKSHIKTWRDFKKRFRERAKGERIAPYINSLRYIVTHFKVPPSERELMETPYRNLFPEYRRAMADKVIDTMDDIEKYGKYWERQKEMNSRYVPPPTADKMRVPGAAPYIETGGKAKVAVGGSREETEAAATGAETPEHKPTKTERRREANQPPRGPAKPLDEAENAITVKLSAMQISPEEESATAAAAQLPVPPSIRPRYGILTNTANRENRGNNWRNQSTEQGQGTGPGVGQPPAPPDHSNGYTPWLHISRGDSSEPVTCARQPGTEHQYARKWSATVAIRRDTRSGVVLIALLHRQAQ